MARFSKGIGALVLLAASGSVCGVAPGADVDLNVQGRMRFKTPDGFSYWIRSAEYDLLEYQDNGTNPVRWGSTAEIRTGPITKKALDSQGRVGGAAGISGLYDNVRDANGADFGVRVYLQTDTTKNHKARLIEGDGSTTKLDMPLTAAGKNKMAGPVTLNHTFGNGGGDPAATYQAIEVATLYANYLESVKAMPVNMDLKVKYNQGVLATFYQHGTKTISIGSESRFSWDAINHEYGHAVAKAANFDDSPGGGHTPWDDVRTSRPLLSDQQSGALAWSEGWAHFYANASQAYAHSEGLLSDVEEPAAVDPAGPSGVKGKSIRETTDRLTAFFLDGANDTKQIMFDFSLEADGDRMHRAKFTFDGGGAVSGSDGVVAQKIALGEYNEVSNARILYDLWDDTGGTEGAKDEVSMGHAKLWNTINGNVPGQAHKAQTISEFARVLKGQAITDAFAAGGTNEQKIARAEKQIAKYGSIFSNHKASGTVLAAALLPAPINSSVTPITPGSGTDLYSMFDAGGSGSEGVTNNLFGGVTSGAFFNDPVDAGSSTGELGLASLPGHDGGTFSAPTIVNEIDITQRPSSLMAFSMLAPGEASPGTQFSLRFLDKNWSEIGISDIPLFDMFGGSFLSDVGASLSQLASASMPEMMHIAFDEMLWDRLSDAAGETIYMQMLNTGSDGAPVLDGMMSNTMRLRIPTPGTISLAGIGLLTIARRKRVG